MLYLKILREVQVNVQQKLKKNSFGYPSSYCFIHFLENMLWHLMKQVRTSEVATLVGLD